MRINKAQQREKRFIRAKNISLSHVCVCVLGGENANNTHNTSRLLPVGCAEIGIARSHNACGISYYDCCNNSLFLAVKVENSVKSAQRRLCFSWRHLQQRTTRARSIFLSLARLYTLVPINHKDICFGRGARDGKTRERRGCIS